MFKENTPQLGEPLTGAYTKSTTLTNRDVNLKEKRKQIELIPVDDSEDLPF